MGLMIVAAVLTKVLRCFRALGLEGRFTPMVVEVCGESWPRPPGSDQRGEGRSRGGPGRRKGFLEASSWGMCICAQKCGRGMAGKISQQGRERRRPGGWDSPVSWRALPNIPGMDSRRARLPGLRLSGVSGRHLTLTQYWLCVPDSS